MQICKCEPNVCQLRLDFVNFTIAGPDDSRLFEGEPSQRTTCKTAQFTATSDGVATPVLCGENSGYHSEWDRGSVLKSSICETGISIYDLGRGGLLKMLSWSQQAGFT